MFVFVLCPSTSFLFTKTSCFALEKMATSNTGRLILGGKFTFKSNSVVVCKIYKCEFKYIHSTSSLISLISFA